MTTKKKHEQHPLSAAFPPMLPEEFLTLQDSISDVGVKTPITMFEGKVLDGWHRHTISFDLGIDCPEEDLPAGADPRKFVLERNHARRSMTASQSALAVAEVNAYHWAGKPAARWRIPTTEKQGGSAPGADSQSITSQQMAAQAGTSVRTIEQAKTVVRQAIPAVKEAVREGTKSLKDAADIAALSPAKQERALTQPRNATKKPRAPTTQPDHSTGVATVSKEAYDEVLERVTILVEENDRLNARLAVAAMEGTDEEKLQAGAMLEELQSQVKQLGAELDAVKASRDSYMTENDELKKTVKSLQRKAPPAPAPAETTQAPAPRGRYSV